MTNYQLLDSGEGRRLEDFDGYIIDRPDPEAIWQKGETNMWKKADAIYKRTFKDKGDWIIKKAVPQNWTVEIDNLKFSLKLTPFKHTGVFPEQAEQWDFIQKSILQSNEVTNFLSLFGYTGGASLAAAKAGAKVTHLDASKPALTWLKQNQDLNNLGDKSIRVIADDALKFTEREIKRGNKYDAVIMDPPVYGHGPKGEKWDFKKDFPRLLDNVSKILSEKPLFVIVNAYAVSTSPQTLKNIMEDKFSGIVSCGELSLQESSKRSRQLTTGIWAKWQDKNLTVK